jgi:hypothetical protein
MDRARRQLPETSLKLRHVLERRGFMVKDLPDIGRRLLLPPTDFRARQYVATNRASPSRLAHSFLVSQWPFLPYVPPKGFYPGIPFLLPEKYAYKHGNDMTHQIEYYKKKKGKHNGLSHHIDNM